MNSIKLSKDFFYQILFAVSIGVTYFNIYELTFLVWLTCIILTIKKEYSITILNIIVPYFLILVISGFSSLFFENHFYEIIRDITYMLKPIIGLVLGYQLCRTQNMRLIRTVIYIGLLISLTHLILIFYNILIHKIINIHELRKHTGYFSDFEVNAFILALFHKKFNIVFSKKVYYTILIIIGTSSFLYLSRANFIQGIILFLALKGFFNNVKKTILILMTFFMSIAIGYSIIYNMNLSRNGKGLEALLYKIKNAPLEAFKTKVDKDDWEDFNDNYRAYENIITVKQVSNHGFFAVIFGTGLGSKINLGQKLYTNDGTVLTKISILHNAFMTVFLKSGLMGVGLLIYSLVLIIKQNKAEDEHSRNLRLFILALGTYLFLDNWVLLGLYLKTESKSIILGMLLCLFEYNQKSIKKCYE